MSAGQGKNVCIVTNTGVTEECHLAVFYKVVVYTRSPSGEIQAGAQRPWASYSPKGSPINLLSCIYTDIIIGEP